MAAQEDVRFSVALPGGTVTFPSVPVDIPDGAYFIWPFGMEMGGVRLAWASAPSVTRIRDDDGPLYVFFAHGGIPAELALGAEGVAHGSDRAGRERLPGP